MSRADVSRSSSRRGDSSARHGRTSKSPGFRGDRERGENDGYRVEKDRTGHRWSSPSRSREGEGSRYASREDEGRGHRDRSYSSRRPVGRMRGWGEGDGNSSSGGGMKTSSGLSAREEEDRDKRGRSGAHSRSRGASSEERAPSRSSARHRSRSRSRQESGNRESSRHREDRRSRPSSRFENPREESSKARHSPARSNSSSSNSYRSQTRRSDKKEPSHRASPSEGRTDSSGAPRKDVPPKTTTYKRRFQEAPSSEGSSAAAEARNGVADARRSPSPGQSSSVAAGKKAAESGAEHGKTESSAETKAKEAAAPSSSSNSNSNADKISRLERFRALKKQKQQPEGESSGGGTPSGVGETETKSSNAFSDWLPFTPNVKFAVSSSSTKAASADTSTSNKAAATSPSSNGPSGAAASAAAAAAAVAAAQAVASAALAAAELAAASVVAAPAQQDQPGQQQEAESGATPADAATTSPSVGAESVRASESPPPGATCGGAEGEKGDMKPPKPMSRSRLKKHQQALLLKQLQHKTSEAVPEAKGGADLLDAFMSALEVEAKEELNAAKAEDEGQVDALGFVSSRGSEPPRPQSISLEEISRWEEVEATYLPPAAVNKTSATAAAATAGAGEAAAPTTESDAGPPRATTTVKGEGQGAAGTAATPASPAAASPPPTEADSPRIKQEVAPGASTADAPAVAAATSPAAASEAAVTNGATPESVKTEGEKSDATGAIKEPAEEIDPEEAKYHELFLETLRKGRPKGLLRSAPGSTATAGDKQAGGAKEAEAEEEEVLLYSDHEEEEEEAAKAAEGTPGASDDGTKEKQDDNDSQAKEQLANLSYFDLVKRVGLKKELPIVDHASCKFPPIKKNLYVQVKELTDLKDHEVEAIRKTNGNIKVRGKQCPRPISSFHQCGLPEKILRHLEVRGFDKPFPVQSQCIPILMCGRDLIAVAETGSGKTLAYSLPLVRHVLSIKRQYKEYLAKQKEEKLLRAEQQQQAKQQQQQAAGEGDNTSAKPTENAAAAPKGNRRGKQDTQDGDEEEKDRYRKNEKGERMLIYGNFKEGMIGLVIAPTRELSLQISKEVTRLCKLVDLNVASLYGGAGIGGQLGQIKRGVDVVVGTPGRLIDVLTLNSCKFTSLKRVTFVVLDEADRMFDYGFEPQISSILRSTRLDRQTCLFSATFPSHIESLARRILYKPIEVVVGEKGRTAAKVQQYVEVLDEERKFYRLLQLLGDWQDYGSIIIFVNKQIEADELFAELLKYGYQALVLHGGQDQTDREFTIQEFKDGTRTLLIATSVAARGLDVPSVLLVINYCCPSHIEDYVHRIGRTGRAGNIGVSYTFITAQEADKAEELEGALVQSGQTVPPALSALSADFRVQCNMGLAQKKKRGGFGGKGFTFSVTERSRQQQQMQQAKKELSGANDFDEVEEVELLLQRDDFSPPTTSATNPQQLALTNTMSTMDAAMAAASAAAAAKGGGAGTSSGSLQSAVEAAAAKAALLVKHQLAGTDAITRPVSSTEAVARVKLVAKILKVQDAELSKRPPPTPPPPPPGLPPPGCEKTKLTIDEQVEFMLQQALKGLPEEERKNYRDKLRDAYKKHLSPRPKIQQKAAPGMQLALASSVTGQPIPKEKDPFSDAAAEALSILKQGTSASSSQLQAALDKIKAFSDSVELAAAISSVSAPSNPTLGKVPGLSEKGFVCPETGNFVDELEINDYPQVARYKLTQKELMSRIMEETGAVLYVKGQHVEPALKHRTQLAPGVKYLHVEIIAPTPIQVQRARHAVYELVESIALKSLNLTSTQRQAMGRYSVV